MQFVHSRGENCSEDLDNVSTKNCRAAELLSEAEEQDDEERFVHLRMLLDVLHVVHLVHRTRLLLLQPHPDLLHLGQAVEAGLVDLHQRSFRFCLLTNGDEMNRRFWRSEEKDQGQERNYGGVEGDVVPVHERSKSVDKDHAWIRIECYAANDVFIYSGYIFISQCNDGGGGILLPPARITASKIENEALSSLLKMYGEIFVCTLTCSCLDDKFMINLTIPGNFNCVDCGAEETMANTHT